MLIDFKLLVDGFVRDESARLSQFDRELAINMALAQYGRERPRRKVADVVCAGGDVLPLPAEWQAGSVLVGAEYPIGEMPPATLPCSIYTSPSGEVLRLGEALFPGAEVRLTFSVAHVVSETMDTVQPVHREAVACYAAALLLEQLSAAAINDGDSTISADTTDRRTKAQEYAGRARALKARYAEAMGSAGGGSGGGSATAAAGQVTAWPSRGRLTGWITRRG